MQTLIDFFSGLASSITNVIDFLLKLCSDFFDFLKLIAMMPKFVIDSLFWIPEEVSIFLIALVSIVAVYKILGRD